MISARRLQESFGGRKPLMMLVLSAGAFLILWAAPVCRGVFDSVGRLREFFGTVYFGG